MVPEAVRARYDSTTVPPGSILMDAPTTATFAELVARAEDKWRWWRLCSDTFPLPCAANANAKANNNNNDDDDDEVIDRADSAPGW